MSKTKGRFALGDRDEVEKKRDEFYRKIDNGFSFYPGELKSFSRHVFFQQTIEIFEIIKSVYEFEGYSSVMCSHPYEMILDHILKPNRKSYYINSYEKSKIINKNNRKSKFVKNLFIEDSNEDSKYDMILIDCHSARDIKESENKINFPFNAQSEIIDPLFDNNLSENGKLIYVVNPVILNEASTFTYWIPTALDELFYEFNKAGSKADGSNNINRHMSSYVFDPNNPPEDYKKNVSVNVGFLEKYAPYLEGIVRLSSVKMSNGGPYSPTALIFSKKIVYDFYVSDLNKIRVKDFIRDFLNKKNHVSKTKLKASWAVNEYQEDFAGKGLVVEEFETMPLADLVDGNFVIGLNIPFLASKAEEKKLWEKILSLDKKRAFKQEYLDYQKQKKTKESFKIISNDSFELGRLVSYDEVNISVPNLIINYVLNYFVTFNEYSSLFSAKVLIPLLKKHITSESCSRILNSLTVRKGDLLIALDENYKIFSEFCPIDEVGLLLGPNVVKISAGKHKPETVLNYISSFINNKTTNELISSYVYQNIGGTTSLITNMFPYVTFMGVTKLGEYKIPLVEEKQIEILFNKKGSKKNDSDDLILIKNLLKNSDWEVTREQKVGKLMLDFGLSFKGELVSYLEMKKKLSNDKDLETLQKRHIKTKMEKGIVCFENNIYVCDGQTFSAASGIPNPSALYPEKYAEKGEISIKHELIDLMHEMNKGVLGAIKKEGAEIKEGLYEIKEKIGLILSGVLEIKQKNLSIENKIKKIEEHIFNTNFGDLKAFEGRVKGWFKYWGGLNDKSKVFMPAAEFYFYHSERSSAVDYSAFILSYCKALENELLTKIFISFTRGLKSKKNYKTYFNLDVEGVSPSKIKRLQRFSSAFEKRFEEEKFTLGEMKEVLKRLPYRDKKTHPVFHRFKVLKELNFYIEKINFKIDADTVSDIEHINENFRNKAAHSDYILREDSLVFLEQYKVIMNKISSLFENK